MPIFISLCKGNLSSMQNALKVLLSWRGIPSVYYGTEIPLAGAKEPDNRADMVFDNQAFYTFIRDALKLRDEHPVLASGKTNVLYYEKDFAVFYRNSEDADENALIVLSQSKKSKSYTLPPGKWLSNEDHTHREGEIDVAPKSVSIFFKKGRQPLDDAPVSLSFDIPDDGLTYAVTGSIAELGNWNPEKHRDRRADRSRSTFQNIASFYTNSSKFAIPNTNGRRRQTAKSLSINRNR